MHDSGVHGIQPYVHCVELTVTGTGTAQPPGVAIPGNWNYEHPAITYNLYSNRNYTVFPGPDVYVAGSIKESDNTDTSNAVLISFTSSLIFTLLALML